ncbi:tetratricopeptide repeat protein [Brevundimonas naejangsanensis]|uniref:tetratricopeptide repeat protein n=1 Tax=Brevundimonas naejangsanensis TaxID=588932 RepID=UPI0013C409A1|nr:tetratricopeptide repeat protein [Brevundimonas naejangsanensis]
MKFFDRLRQGLRRGAAASALAALTVALTGVAPAHADWLKAESERFIVYSDGGESKLRQFVQELEGYDRFLRLRMGLAVDEAPPRKLPIYLVNSRSGLLKVSPDLHENIAGFYTATNEDIFGIALRDQTVDTLKHEYAHHFMMQNFSYPYPGWFVEGFAEYYATVEIEKSRILVGKYNENRAYWLQAASWMPMTELLSKRPSPSTRSRDTYYPLAWLLTHWFLGDTDRQKALSAYLRDVGAGGDPVEAMQRATGLDPTELRRTLRRYMNGRIPYQGVMVTYPPVPITVTRLSRSADDLLLLNQRLKIGVPTEKRAATTEEVRRAAARHPDDPLALLALGHAELHFGDPAAAEAPLQRLLALDPNHVEALQYLARARMEAAEDADDLEDSDRLRGEAQGFLARAYRADDANYATLLLIAENRSGAPGYPNDNDLAVLEQAFVLAPQLGAARINLAQVLMSRDRNDEAIALLEPMVNDPHRPSPAARTLLLRAKGQTEDEAAAQEAALASLAEDEDDEADGL